MAVSSTSSNSISNLSAKTGMGGLVSGMDIDSLVEKMTATSRQKILKQKQNVQKLEWKQTAYRSVTTALKEFQTKYLDVLSKSNFRSTAFFNTIKAASSSDAVSVTSTSAAITGNIKIDSITQLATNQTITMAEGATATKELTSSGSVRSFIDGLEAGDSISLTLDGRVRTITFDSDFVNAVQNGTLTDADKAQLFESKFQSLINTAFGSDGSNSVISVSVNSDKLTFSAEGSRLTLSSVNDNDTLTKLGFTSGQSNKIVLGNYLSNQNLKTPMTASSDGYYRFEINGEEFEFDNTATLSAVIEKINSSKAGVTISYSSLNDRFTMTAKESGSGDNITISDKDGSNLMKVLGLSEDSGAVSTAGVNAILKVNGQTISRSSNSFELDGVKLTLNKTTDEAVTLTMTNDATSLKDTIKSFVEDYNAMISLVNGLITEKANSDYQPLSDEEKSELSETEIKNWETKAKSGILKGDSLLRDISSKLHSSMLGISVNDFSLYSMGITSAGYTENGKLEINEEKLEAALETKGSEIRNLFTEIGGIGTSLNNIITNATKTSGVKGSRGTLVEAAGVENTISQTENSIYEQIKRTNKTITTLQSRLTNEETRLWKRFTAMETAINGLNTQSSILSQFSSNS
ncbi:hypothetical protein FRZ06_11835 [Anoxybacterium hadale]|uniref:Uncharacterized protein n=1 Tax=Anoxybacterium hadale TaxID=3408580 RepID=A0ACD1ACR6_9FIRM|nr:hypothetical protein FRZ06_11835 [Clostridiales bacterium]